MSEPVKSKFNGTTIAWMFAFCVFFLAIGGFGGYKVRDHQFEKYRSETISVVDSLNRLSLQLRDSVRILSIKEVAQEKIVYKYRTLYDTITLKQDVFPIVNGLNQIAQTPIK